MSLLTKLNPLENSVPDFPIEIIEPGKDRIKIVTSAVSTLSAEVKRIKETKVAQETVVKLVPNTVEVNGVSQPVAIADAPPTIEGDILSDLEKIARGQLREIHGEEDVPKAA